jgi:hypothetical protein
MTINEVHNYNEMRTLQFQRQEMDEDAWRELAGH